MAVNKVILGNETLVDLTDTTATAEDVAAGKIFYAANGVQTTGTANVSGVSVFYGTCATAAATAAKVVVCEEFTTDDLVEGTVVNVKFTYAQTYNGAPTLNVNSTGAKNIKRVGTTNAARYEWVAGEMLQFVYDGSYWVLTDGGIATTTYYGVTKLSSATNSTSNSLAATASAVKAAYDLANGKQDELVSGTNIKTINGNSLLGSGDLAVGGSVTMEDTAVDAAVEAAWPAPTGYAITPVQAQINHGNLLAIGLSDDVEQGEFVATAGEGETVYVMGVGHWEPDVTTDSTGTSVSWNFYSSSQNIKLYTFTMPAEAVTVDMNYND